MTKEPDKKAEKAEEVPAVAKSVEPPITEPYRSPARLRQLRDHFSIELPDYKGVLKILPLFRNECAKASAYRLNVVATDGRVTKSYFVKVYEPGRRGTLQQVLARLLDEPVKVLEVTPQIGN